FPWGWKIAGKPWGLPDDVDERVHGPCAMCAVGQQPKGATPEGIQDMKGLVEEWTASVLCPDPADTRGFDPKKCTQIARVVRGGYWQGYAIAAPCYVRGGNVTEDTISEIGFRCAQRVEASETR